MCQVYIFLWQFLNSPILPDLMQSVGLALLTILIPVVLFIFSFSSKREIDLFEWDKVVILDKVIQAKKLLISVTFIFLPLFFWSLLPKFILFPFFCIGVFNLVEILLNSYYWIKTVEIQGDHDLSNFRDNLRNRYLEETNNLSEKEKIWILTWRQSILNTAHERNLLKKFVENIDALIKNENFDFLQRYLQNFFAFLSKRTLSDWTIFETFFEKLLEWFFSFCAQGETKNNQNSRRFFEIKSFLSRLIEKFVLSALQKGPASLLFEVLEKGIEGKKDTDCIKRIFDRSVCMILFDNFASSQEKNDIWRDYFPKKWKITKTTYQDGSNVMSKIWFDQFFAWALSRDWGSKKYDSSLDIVASQLFPSVEPVLWAKILTLIMRTGSADERIKLLVEQGTNFGLLGRVIIDRSTSEEGSGKLFFEYRKRSEDETLELTLILFKQYFTIEELQIYINCLNKLGYDKGTREESRRENFITIFEKMILCLRQKKS